MDDASAEARIGALVDSRYKILEVMAAGAMGSVYKAERIPVGKIVAIKFLHASFANDTEFQTRFERETRVMSKLAHPNCVSVLDFGVWEGAPYLVMEHVAGITLRARIDKGPLPVASALAIARQIAAGLAHAHEQGVFHRDIKPANIMITDEIGHGERVRILDFGLARLRGNVGRDATQTNMVVGTPNYMAPEQTVPGGAIDARTDIYALGIVVFEMLTGERPFNAEETLQILAMQRAAPIPRLVDRAPSGVIIVDGIQQLIDRAMAKKPDDRFQSAIAMAEAIDALIKPDSATSPIETRRRSASAPALAPTMLAIEGDSESTATVPPSRFWPRLFAAMLLVGGAAAMAGYVIHHNRDEASAPRASARLLDAAPALAAPLDAAAVALATVSDAAIADAAPDDALADAADANATIDASDDLVLDPETAEDLDPVAKAVPANNDDEAADAPATTAEAANKAPASPQLATTLPDAIALIKEGKRDLALASLRALRTKQPKNAYIPFLLGNLYYDQKWWSVAMDDYHDAITKAPAFKNNPTLNRNVIRMLASTKTRQKAANFLRGVIGHPAGAFLREAAKKEPNSTVRKEAANLARMIR